MNDEYYQDFDSGEEEAEEFYAIRPNKTRIKQEIAAVSAMAEAICQLSPAQVAEFELPESIEQAILDAMKMGHNSARKRLLKYITAQLRNIDIEAVQEKLARLQNRSAHAVREHHQLERWRDQLLTEAGAQHLTQLILEYPAIDSQHIRQLQRNAQKETREGKPPKSARLLYKYLKEIITGEE